MAKKTFNLGDYLKDAAPLSDSDNEQITRIPLDRIDADERNFYSLEGVAGLAANIETVGLLDPLRVRPSGERYVIVSGHRRRAALQLLADGGNERWRDGVPCIVEFGEASAAMTELRLIFANSSTRVMSAADLSRQAERVTELLYELKEQGVEFPGSMRAHVAEACKVSESKLARLRAIRKKLEPVLLRIFDAGTMPEETAYQLSRLPADIQLAVGAALASGQRKAMPKSDTVEAVVTNLERLLKPLSCRAHAGGPACHNVTERIVRSVWASGSWDVCAGNCCCMDCYRKDTCRGACKEATDRAKLDAAVEKEKQAAEEKRQTAARAARLRTVRARCRELLPLIEAAGLGDGDKLYSAYTAAKVSDVKAWAAGDFGDKAFWSDEPVRPTRVEDLQSMAKTLGVTAGRLLGEKPEPEAAALSESDNGPGWEDGTPPAKGWYVCWAQWCGSRVPFDPDYEVLYWGGCGWDDSEGEGSDPDYRVIAWSRIPPRIAKEAEG